MPVIQIQHPTLLFKNNPIHGIYLKCTEMFGNRVMTGLALIQLNLLQIQLDHPLPHIGCYMEAAGIKLHITHDQLFEDMLDMATVQTLLVCDFCGHLNYNINLIFCLIVKKKSSNVIIYIYH